MPLKYGILYLREGEWLYQWLWEHLASFLRGAEKVRAGRKGQGGNLAPFGE